MRFHPPMSRPLPFAAALTPLALLHGALGPLDEAIVFAVFAALLLGLFLYTTLRSRRPGAGSDEEDGLDDIEAWESRRDSHGFSDSQR